MAIGTVKWFNDAKGFGFITQDGGGPDVFVHHSAISVEGFRTLQQGQRVSFQLLDSPKGLHAREVHPLPEGTTSHQEEKGSVSSPPEKRSIAPGPVPTTGTGPLAALLALASSFGVTQLSATDRGSIYSVGARLRQSTDFQAAAREVFVHDASVTKPGKLAVALATAMRQQKITRDPALVQVLAPTIEVIESLAKLAFSGLSAKNCARARDRLMQEVQDLLRSSPEAPNESAAEAKALASSPSPRPLPASVSTGNARAAPTPVRTPTIVGSPVQALVNATALPAQRSNEILKLEEQAPRGTRSEQAKVGTRDELVKDVTPVGVPLVANAISPESSQDAPERLLASWLKSTRGEEATELASVLQDAAVLLRDVPLADGLEAVRGLAKLAPKVEVLQTKLPVWQAAVENASRLLAQLEEVQPALNAAYHALGDDLDFIIQGTSVSREELLEITALGKDRRLLNALPAWVFEEPTGLASSQDRRRYLAFPRVRQIVRATLLVLEEHSALDPEVLKEIAQPPAEADAAMYLEDALRARVSTRQLLQTVPPEYGAWLGPALDRGERPERLSGTIQRLEEFRGQLKPETFSAVTEKLFALHDPDRREESLRSFERAIRRIVDLSKSALDAPFSMLERLALQEPASAVDHSGSIEFNHNFVDENRSRAPITYIPSQDGLPYGHVSVPILVLAPEAKDCQMRLQCEVLSLQREAWPREWGAPTPADLFIRAADWRRHTTGNQRFAFAFKLTIPIRRPTGEQKLEITLQPVEPKANAPMGPLARLSWPKVEITPPQIMLDWPDLLNPRHVLEHPVGPQEEHVSIRERIRQCGSFAVIAPRRFGKTTLARYIYGLRDELGVLIPSPFQCTSYYESDRLNYPELWRKVSDALLTDIGAALDLNLDDELPGQTAFHHVRRAAKRQGKRAILILFDEAQLFFPRGRGALVGDRFKDLLENYWTTETDDMVPVLFGFLGLQGLERAGANFLGRVRAIPARKIREDGLNSLILKVTGRQLHTTREAREQIIAASRNLQLLREFTEKLISAANHEKRAWVSYDDVVAAEAELRQELLEGENSRVGQSLADVFNDAESAREFRPSSCFAVALALARTTGLVETRISTATELLTRWAREVDVDAGLHRIVFTRENVAEQVRELEERGVFKDNEFTSELFEAWLQRGSKIGCPRVDGFKESLFAAGIRRVRRPSGCERIDEGGQASVFRFRSNEELFAYRQSRIDSDEDRRRFLDSSRALVAVMRGVSRRENGSEYVFDLREMGLLEEDESAAVQIYRWIDGFDLGQKLGSLPEPLAVDVGYKVALALRWLHKQNILHRDISPRNIILASEQMKPVLIDFGLARLSESPLKTRLVGEFSAPEVGSAQPRWSPAADTWALGKTLKALLRERPSQELGSLLEECGRERPEERPTGDALVEKLWRIEQASQLMRQREDAWSTIFRIIEPDARRVWYYELVEKHRAHFQAILLGCHSTLFERATDIAEFANQLLEAQTRSQLSLGRVKHSSDKAVTQLAIPAIAAMHELRNYRDHGSRGRRTVLAKLGNPSDADLTQLTLSGVERLEGFLGLKSFVPLAKLLLQGRA